LIYLKLILIVIAIRESLMDMCIKLPDWVNFVAMQAGNLTDCELCVAWSDNPAARTHI
jgi:hypothetical protein